MEKELIKYQSELQTELDSILSYWKKYSLDELHGGFVGRIDEFERVDALAAKGSVLNARILWTFSAAYNFKADPQDLHIAQRAFRYINDNFIDQDYGGVYWLLDASGQPLDSKKQVYAIAFTIYAFSEYHSASQDPQARRQAIALYHKLLEHSYDWERGGYFEAFTRNWAPLEDLRLSDKDANEKKTMNTHLHVLEAFTTLYRIWPDQGLKVKIIALIENFLQHIVQPAQGNLLLFFDEYWEPKSRLVSYGHDIEAAWLLLEAAEVIQEDVLIERVKDLSLKMAEASISGIAEDGALYYEYDPEKNHLIKEKHWWVQAEGMVGFFNAWQLSGENKFLQLSLGNWHYVQNHLVDRVNGEWFWGIGADGQLMKGEDKMGLWKCPYHNSRACMEIIKRINKA
ncbi:AGE family epimerase/isomerase [Pedobacter jeongneungensis]|uniref:AGE family epimerase/isomerase n=1 Tax=Pedobacter jeongneungensis TaxID=947309 RepID=UPI000468E90B|nr:AGE family epimerase/isomerase [Pedobacter jeongneungensis]